MLPPVVLQLALLGVAVGSVQVGAVSLEVG
jgi:hypothetical protein